MSGTIDSYELMELRSKGIKLSRADKMMGILSTHLNMLKRVKHLASLMGSGKLLNLKVNLIST
jgi:hypothetical protein